MSPIADGDTDYFRVSLPAGRTLVSTLTPNSSSDYDLFVYHSNGATNGRYTVNLNW